MSGRATLLVAFVLSSAAAFAQPAPDPSATPPGSRWQTTIRYGPAPTKALTVSNAVPTTATPAASSSPQITPPTPAASSAPSTPAPSTPSTTAPTMPPPVSMPEHLTSFDTLGVNVSWTEHGWELMNGDKVLKEFGRHEADARQALRVLRDLHLTQYGTVGTPYPVMEYWLSEGHAPWSAASGMRAMPLDPMSLKVEQVRGQWCLRDGQRVLFNFGSHQTDAHAGLEVLKKYGFNQVATIGQNGASMLVFLGPPGREAQSPPFGSRLHPLSHHNADDAAKPGSPTNNPAADLPIAPVLPSLRGPEAASAHIHPDTLTQRAESHATTTFKAPGEIGERVAFDWHQLQLRREQGEWTLQAGRMVFAHFNDEHEGQQALRAMQYYRINEERRLNDGGAAFFLSNGQAPRGLMFSVNSQAIQPESLQVRQVGDRWAICAGDLPVLRYGNRPDEAQRMLQAIRQYHFDRLCRFGPPGGDGLTLLVRTR